MRILFDQGTPAPLREVLGGHSVETAYEKGWSSLSNGDLLTAAEGALFDVLVTTDQNLRYQQNLQARQVAHSSFANHPLAGNSAACPRGRHRN